jgi:hypothetical protein
VSGVPSGANQNDLAQAGKLARIASAHPRTTLKILKRARRPDGMMAGRYARLLAGTVTGSEQR